MSPVERPDYREDPAGPSTRYPPPYRMVNVVVMPDRPASKGTCDLVDANGYILAVGVDIDWASWVICNVNNQRYLADRWMQQHSGGDVATRPLQLTKE